MNRHWLHSFNIHAKDQGNLNFCPIIGTNFTLEYLLKYRDQQYDYLDPNIILEPLSFIYISVSMKSVISVALALLIGLIFSIRVICYYPVLIIIHCYSYFNLSGRIKIEHTPILQTR